MMPEAYVSFSKQTHFTAVRAGMARPNPSRPDPAMLRDRLISRAASAASIRRLEPRGPVALYYAVQGSLAIGI